MNKIEQLIQQLCPEEKLFQGITDSSLSLGMTKDTLSGGKGEGGGCAAPFPLPPSPFPFFPPLLPVIPTAGRNLLIKNET
jgi:hypothetical protein